MASTATANAPRFRNSLICCSPNTNLEALSSTPSSSTSGCVSAEESFESSTLIPKTLANKNLKVKESATRDELLEAIEQCKDLVLNNAQCSDERKWLVRHLVELRFRLEELKDDSGAPPRLGVSTKGHHFKHQSLVTMPSTKQYCDHCSGVIWSIVQGSYICEDCGYLSHYKCIDNVCRVCAHVVITENGRFEMEICPEKGLSTQEYKCAECHTTLVFKTGWNEPRLCDYTGSYYCATCHWNDTAVVPARVIHNWDWDERPVSRSTRQLLTIADDKPLIDITAINSKLFMYIAELQWVDKMRKDLQWMRRYLASCGSGTSMLTPLLVQLGDGTQKYSMSQLRAIKNGTLETQLTELTEKCRDHITKCYLCSAKGYICEVCGNREVLYPFDSGAVMCSDCNSVYHRSCFLRKNQTCLRCVRLNERRKLKSEDEIDTYTDNDLDKFV